MGVNNKEGSREMTIICKVGEELNGGLFDLLRYEQSITLILLTVKKRRLALAAESNLGLIYSSSCV